MNRNDYGYQSGENIFLAMYDKDLLTHSGQAPTIYGACTLEKEQKPLKAEASFYAPQGGYLLYNIAPLNTSDFTLDFWMRYQQGYSGVTTQYQFVETGIAVQNEGSWLGQGVSSFPSQLISSDGSFKIGQWGHYAVVRQGATLYYFIDGILQASVRQTKKLDLTSTQLAVNIRYIDAHVGEKAHYSSIRLCNFARWTIDFTPPIPNLTRDNKLYLKNNAVYGNQ